MIKAEELRIGNWVSNIHTNEDYQLTPQRWINLLRHFYPKDDCGVSMCYIKPIPLTEEWLIKLGFVSNPYQDRYEQKEIYIDFDKIKGSLMLWESRSGVVVETVHQLQNLYYALTGTELDIKQP